MGTFSDLRLSFRRATLLVAVLAAATFPTLAAAETTQLTFSVFGSFITNPCTEESVALEGLIHFYTQTQSDGTMRFWFNSQDVKGTALVTEVRYVAQDTTHSEFDLPPGTTEETYTRIHLVRKAEDATLLEDDDFHMRALLTVTVPEFGPPIVEDVELTTDPCH
jgi:hypothetical protein